MAEAKRVRRTPINGLRNKIPTVRNPDPDYVYRYVYDNGTDNRVQAFQDLGYELVDNKSVQVADTRRVADPTPIGSSIVVPSGSSKLYLMRQKKEYYEEDDRTKQAELDKTDASMSAPANGLSGKVEISRS